MAQTRVLLTTLDTKVALIGLQIEQLHAELEDEFVKLTSKAKEMLEKEEQDQDVNTLTEINSAMDTVWGCFVQASVQMKDILSSTKPGGTDKVLTQASSFADVSSATGDSESLISGPHSMLLPETAGTPCDNEVGRDEVTDKYKNDLGIQIREVKASDSQVFHSQVLDQQSQRLASLERLTYQSQCNMTKEIKDLEKTFEDNSRRTKQELHSGMDHIKEHDSKFDEVEKRLISIQKDVQSLKSDQRTKQNKLDTIQGLEKQVETLTSQFDNLQDQVGKIEPVMQIATLATDEQLQELIKATTATSRSLEELTFTVEDTQRSVRERDENRRREMEDRLAVLAGKRQEDLDHYTKELQETITLLKKMKEDEQERWSQIDSIHKDVENLKGDQRNNQQLVKIQGLEKHMETLTSQCDSLQDQVEKIEISTQATDEQVQELIQTSTATSRSMEELTSRLEETERSVAGCVEQYKKNENRRRKMEDRVAVLEAKRQQDLDHYTKELEKTNFLIENLRKDAENMSIRLYKIEHSRVGFTAYCKRDVPVKQGTITTDFTTVLFNKGNAFNSTTGKFTCPTNGLYVFFATVSQLGNADILLSVKRKSNDNDPPTEICWLKTDLAKSNDLPMEICRLKTNLAKAINCGLAVVELQIGDTVFVQMSVPEGNSKLTHYSSFSGFQIA